MADGRRTVNPIHKKLSGFESHPPHKTKLKHMDNKETLKRFGKVVLLVLVGFIALITSCGVWNGVAEGAIGSFYGWVAGINLVSEGVGTYFLYKKLFPRKEKKEEEDKKSE